MSGVFAFTMTDQRPIPSDSKKRLRMNVEQSAASDVLPAGLAGPCPFAPAV